MQGSIQALEDSARAWGSICRGQRPGRLGQVLRNYVMMVLPSLLAARNYHKSIGTAFREILI